MSRTTITKALPAGAVSSSLSGVAAMLGNGGGRPEPGYGGAASAMFGPGQPPDAREIGGDPRQSQYRPYWNLPTLPGEGRLIDYKTLRVVAKIDPFVRKAIEVRKDQIKNLSWDLIARDRKDAKKARATVQKQQEKIAEIKSWMERPDGRHSWSGWLDPILEDMLVVDGVAIYKRRNLDPDAGPVSVKTGKPMGQMLWMEGIDAATIKPLMDTSGRIPMPPLDAYQQFLFGLPVFGFTTEEMIYARRSSAYDTPYGYSAVEQFLSLINLNLRYWSSMNAIYTDGTLPEGIVTAPEGWTPQQISAFADNWNKALAGDPRALRKLHMAPHGVGWIAFKEHTFDKELTRFLLDILCVAMDLTPGEMGMEPMHGTGLNSKGTADGQERVGERRSVGPTVKFLCDEILNPTLWSEFGLTDLEFAVVEKQTQDEEKRARAEDIDLRNGRISLDELVEADGGEPPGVGRLFVLGPTTVLGEKDLITLTEQGAAALGLLQPVALDKETGLPIPPPAPAAIGPDGKPLTDPKTGEPLQHPTMGPDGAPLALPMPNKPMVPPAPAGGAPIPGAPKAGPGTAATKLADPVNFDAMMNDLHRWELKALRTLKRKGSPAVAFVSEYIPDELAARIAEKVSKATSVDEVKAAFIDDVLKQEIRTDFDNLTLAKIAESMATLASREMPTPYVNVHVEAPKAGDIYIPKAAPVVVNVPKPDPVVVNVAAPIVEKKMTARRTEIRERDADGRPTVIETVEG